MALRRRRHQTPKLQAETSLYRVDGRHITVVSPTGNIEPLIGVHAVVVGMLPPTTVGEA